MYAGLAQGMYTRQIVCHRFAPSIIAASPSALGTVLKCWRSRKMAIALPRNGSMTPSLVSYRPSSERVMKFGMISTSLGMMICMKMTMKTSACPLKLKNAREYAASVEVTNWMQNVPTTRMIVLR